MSILGLIAIGALALLFAALPAVQAIAVAVGGSDAGSQLGGLPGTLFEVAVPCSRRRSAGAYCMGLFGF